MQSLGSCGFWFRRFGREWAEQHNAIPSSQADLRLPGFAYRPDGQDRCEGGDFAAAPGFGWPLPPLP
jgi:hypothetical protein